MLLRYEDKRFYSHKGVDPRAMLRAAGQAVWNGGVVSGGSTLTMQVARLLEDGPTGRWAGKLRQVRLALALERQLSKEEILALYLTHAPYGGNLEGIRAAALAWFGKEPRRLTPSEAALLVALPQSPAARRPDRSPDAARAARNRVLSRMEGQNVISAAALDMASDARLPGGMRPFPQLAPHAAERMRAAGPEVRRIDLTIDAGVQARMELLAARAVSTGGARLSVAILVADHQSGEILASVGSPGLSEAARHGFVDMTQALRSPGSTLKPLVYALAFDQGLVHPETLIHDGPMDFGGYAPRNFDGRYRGDLRVREALQQSLNIPVVMLTQEIGPARLMAALRRAGTRAQLPGGAPGLAVSLGGAGVSLEGLVQLYATIAAGGQGKALRLMRHTVPEQRPRTVSPAAAWQVMDILRGLAPPPGARAKVLAYKTGTSYGHRDAWAVGWDGQHVIGVWLGRADGTPVPGVFGGELAAPVLFEAFGHLKPEFTPLLPPPPETLIAGSAALPLPLQRFRPRGAAFAADGDAPQLLFPPDGARLLAGEEPLAVKLRGGQPPFLVLADGEPLASGLHLREFEIENPGRGFSALVVVDSAGRSDRASVQIE
jgi:penicillin-binding protein 1C